MAEVAVPSISTAPPADADTVLGVQAGAVKRFVVGDVRRAAANPTATVGLAAKNGTAVTFMRSDAAPALDPAILTQTGEGSKIPQLGSGGTLTLNSASLSTEYGSDAIFNTGTGQWVDLDFGLQELDFIKSGEDTVSIGISGVDAGSKPITTSHVPAAANDVVNKAYADSLSPVVAADGKVNQAANLNVPALYVVPVSGMYRVSVFLVLSRAATTSSVLPGCNISYTEPTTSSAVSDIATLSANTNLVGLHTSASVVILAQQGSNIGYTTSGYTTSGATTMLYAIQVKVERI